MITPQDLFNIVGNKMANEAKKSIIRNNFLRKLQSKCVMQ